jgi:hypothetical protein
MGVEVWQALRNLKKPTAKNGAVAVKPQDPDGQEPTAKNSAIAVKPQDPDGQEPIAKNGAVAVKPNPTP